MSFKKVLFVCLGNSCCSPMAEAIMQNLMIKTSLYWEVDSAGLRTWNVGRRPNKKCLRILKEHGLKTDHFCRLFSLDDFRYYDYIIAMNLNVYKELRFWASNYRTAKHYEIYCLSWFGKNGREAPIADLTPMKQLKTFRNAYYQIKECSKAFIVNQRIRFVQYETRDTETDSTGDDDEVSSHAYRKHNERLYLEDQMAKKRMYKQSDEQSSVNKEQMQPLFAYKNLPKTLKI